MNPESVSTPAEQLQSELDRIRAKRAAATDTDLFEALDWKIGQLEQRLAALEKPAEEPEPEVEMVPPTPQELLAADALIRQARVEKMRGNASASTDLLRKAAEAAPTAPAVLEALADDLVERRQKKEAMPIYKKAVALDPKNVGLERKYAMLVLGSAGVLSFEEAMRADWSDSPFLSANDHVASAGAATILTVFLPGLGHIVLGKTVTGVMILSAWVASFLWLTLMKKDLYDLLAKVSGHSTASVNYVVIMPILLLAIIFIGAINSLRTPKRSAGRTKAGRPTPPVNLPFD
jgi:tetratricopeptide (TPR) repeat protein